jgi:hypothetical protein
MYVLVAQAAATSPAPQATWNSITLGAPASTLRPVLGDPLRILLFKDGTRRVARYWIPGANSTYAIVIEERGYVTGFDIFADTAPTSILENVPPDPLGIRLGDAFENVKAPDIPLRRGVDENGAPILTGRFSPAVGMVYSFQDNRVGRIEWATALPAGKPELSPLTDPGGEATSSAILDMQKNEIDGVDWEYRYISFHPCTDTVRWKLQSQSLLSQNGRAFDKLHVVCPPTKAERDFYFDITNYFGKL